MKINNGSKYGQTTCGNRLIHMLIILMTIFVIFLVNKRLFKSLSEQDYADDTLTYGRGVNNTSK